MDGCFAFIGGGDHPANHHGKFDFDEKALKDCLDEFASRDRRFGGLTS